MKFGKLLLSSELAQYHGRYLDYKVLKSELKKKDSLSSTHFFQLLNAEKDRLDEFVHGELEAWRKWLDQLLAALEKQKYASDEEKKGTARKDSLMRIQLESLELQKSVIEMEQFVNLNYTAISKILKKHDKVAQRKTRDTYLKKLEANSFYSSFDAHKLLNSLKNLSDAVYELLQSSPPSENTPITPPNPPSQTAPEPKSPWSIAVFLFGTFLGQVANNVGQVIMPLVLFSFTTSPTTVSLVLTLTSISNGVGSLFGGWIFGSVSQKRWLLAATNIGRGIILGFSATLFAAGTLTLPMSVILFCCDYAILGVIDTVRNAAPASFVGQDRAALEVFNTKYQIAFDLGTTVGPLLAGLVIKFWSFSQAMWIAPVTFVLVGLNSTLIDSSVKEQEESSAKNSPLASIRQLMSNPGLLSIFFLTLTLQLYRIKSVYAATFAEVFTNNPDEITAWLMAVFGIGGLLGALLFSSAKGMSENAFSLWGYSGLLVLTVSWMPQDVWFVGVCILFFSATNVLVRLCFQAKLQSVIKKGSSGGVMGLNRTGVKVVTAIQQLVFGLSFSAGEYLSSVTGGSSNIIAYSLFSAFVILLLLIGFLLARLQERWNATPESSNLDPESNQRSESQKSGTISSGDMTSFPSTPTIDTNMSPRTHLLLTSRQQQQMGDLKPVLLDSKSSDAKNPSNLRLRTVSGQSRKRSSLTFTVDQPESPIFPPPPPHHQQKGAFIVFEGVDGSGKSTQLDWIHDKLCAEGYDVVVTRWNSSAMLSETIKRAKRAQKLTPVTFSIMQAGDSAEQLKEVILPALKHGKVVLSDRFFFTSLARDTVRGMDPAWLRSLFNFVVSPDLVMYFKVPVATAISRVLHRRRELRKIKRMKARAYQAQHSVAAEKEYSSDADASDAEEETLPEAAEREEEESNDVELNFYEAGLDCHLSDDPLENFHLFQRDVMSKYDQMVEEYGFEVIDATSTRDAMFTSVQSHVEKALEAKSKSLTRCLESDPLHLHQFGWYSNSEELAFRKELVSGSKRPIQMFFRTVLLPMRSRFSQLMNLTGAPLVLLHGNPHVDNYAKTQRGTAMIDFDRSCYGPYPFDLVRFLVSLSIFQQPNASFGSFLAPSVLEALRQGYLRGCNQPHLPFIEMKMLKKKFRYDRPLTTNEYIQLKQGWAKKLEENTIYVRKVPSGEDAEPIPHHVQTLFDSYMKSRSDDFKSTYHIERVAEAKGSLGLSRFLIVLVPQLRTSGSDRLLIDLKSVIKCDEVSDDGYYVNPFDHNGKRMIEASHLYAPGCTQHEGWGTDEAGKEYYGRSIPPWKEKIKNLMDEEELADIAMAVGSQLGRAHRLSIGDYAKCYQKGAKASDTLDLAAHFRMNYGALVHAAATLKMELVTAYYNFKK